MLRMSTTFKQTRIISRDREIYRSIERIEEQRIVLDPFGTENTLDGAHIAFRMIAN